MRMQLYEIWTAEWSADNVFGLNMLRLVLPILVVDLRMAVIEVEMMIIMIVMAMVEMTIDDAHVVVHANVVHALAAAVEIAPRRNRPVDATAKVIPAVRVVVTVHLDERTVAHAIEAIRKTQAANARRNDRAVVRVVNVVARNRNLPPRRRAVVQSIAHHDLARRKKQMEMITHRIIQRMVLRRQQDVNVTIAVAATTTLKSTRKASDQNPHAVNPMMMKALEAIMKAIAARRKSAIVAIQVTKRWTTKMAMNRITPIMRKVIKTKSKSRHFPTCLLF